MARFAIKRIDQGTISPTGKVIKAEDYLRVVESEQMIAEIEQQAQVLYQQKKDEAYKSGEIEAQKVISTQMLDSAATMIDYLSKVEQQLTNIVVEAVKKIIGELEETEATTRVVKNALYKVRNESHITLRVSPEQAKAIQGQIKEVTAAYPNIDFVDVVSDQEITRGACRLETELGSIDTSIDLQITLLQQALAKNFQVQ